MGPADYARRCVEALAHGEQTPLSPPDPLFGMRAACFVSIKKGGALRGCIGTLEAAEPDLAHEIIRNARCAASQDPRFPAVTEDELPDLTYSVDVLSPSEPADMDSLDPRRYGVIVECGLRRGVLLPDLPGVEDAGYQVEVALQKARIGPDEDFKLRRFTVTRYREGEVWGTSGSGGACEGEGEETPRHCGAEGESGDSRA